jgi:hypothetical protein
MQLQHWISPRCSHMTRATAPENRSSAKCWRSLSSPSRPRITSHLVMQATRESCTMAAYCCHSATCDALSKNIAELRDTTVHVGCAVNSKQSAVPCCLTNWCAPQHSSLEAPVKLRAHCAFWYAEHRTASRNMLLVAVMAHTHGNLA